MGGICSKDRSLQQVWGEGRGEGGAESVSGGKKRELGAGILTSCPSSGSAPGWLCDLERKHSSSPSPLFPPLERNASKGKAHRPRRPCQGRIPCPPLGTLLPAAQTGNANDREAILPRGCRRLGIPGLGIPSGGGGSAKGLEPLAQERERQQQAVRGPGDRDQ